MANLLAEGMRLHQAGQLGPAKRVYQRILELEPSNPDALHLLGVIEHQTGNHTQAVELIQKAIRRNGKVAFYYNNLGECWRALQDFEQALRCFDLALARDVALADAHANRGTVLKTQGRFQEAIRAYERSLSLRPKDARNLANMAAAYCEWGRYAEAADVARRAAAAGPAVFEAWLNLGVALRNLGQNAGAVDACRRALQLRPNEPGALNCLGIALHRLGRPQEAARVLQTAARLAPTDAQTFINLGNLWREFRHFEQAERCYRRALELDPNSADALNSLGIVAQEQGCMLTAIKRFERCLELDPGNCDAWTNLGVVWRRMAESEKALEAYRAAVAKSDRRDIAMSNMIYAFQFCTGISPEEICRQARNWGEEMVASRRWKPPRDRRATRGERRLRIGYVSGDFRGHPVAYFMVRLLEHHDRHAFEVFCYSTSPLQDEWTTRLARLPEHWVPAMGMSDTELTDRIYGDDIDFLIDLTGHTARNRLRVFANQPARFQATYLGYPGTTGLPVVNYRISDRWADPPTESVGHYVEQLLLLDRCAWCYEPPVNAHVEAVPPSARGESITFGCFNNYAKVSEALLEAWRHLFDLVPRARLLLKGKVFNEGEFVRATQERLAKIGIDPQRVCLEGHTSDLADHFAAYNRVDVALDTFPYHGTTTTCDALWMGVPVVTWRGDRHAARVGASLLTAVGLAEFVADDARAYAAKAAQLAQTTGRLAELRQTLRRTMEDSPLRDGLGLARSFEGAIRGVVN